MSDIISRKYLLDLASNDGAYDYVSAKEIAEAPSIEEKEGVRIIWEHQIDDLIKQIEDIPTIKESDTGKMILMGEGMKREVIKILEDAKK